MSDPLRTDPTRPPDASGGLEREGQIEHLLLAGLDHYFTGEYDQAINVWTRVLFIDRGHARARAYIERARGALAERQRESEELLHGGIAAFDRGDTGTARRLLTVAVERGGPHEVALALLERMDRLEAAGALADAAAAPPADPRRRVSMPALPRPASGTRRHRAIALALAAMLVLAATAGYFAWTWERFDAAALLKIPGREARPVSAPPPEPLPMPRAAESALARARSLFAAGRLRDALRSLGAIDAADPLFPEAERIRADIQRELLAAGYSPAPALPPPSAAPVPPAMPGRDE